MRYFSLFSGIGGFEKGLENSKYDFECVGYSEVDKYAKSIYKRHFPNHKGFGDATKINTKELPNFDLLVGGFPCQSFSISGNRKGFDDTRGTLFFEIARVLKDKKPRYFLLENVRNLLSHDKGNTFSTIIRVLSDLGYNVEWEIYNSKDYGVPQRRERLFIKGYYGKRSGQKILPFRRNGRKIMDTKIKPKKGWFKLNEKEMMPVTKEGDAFALTTRCRSMPFSNHQDNYVVSAKNCIRRITPLECERLQGFEDNYTKYGKNNELISNTQRYKCVGNAVTTTVITAIINEMFDGIGD